MTREFVYPVIVTKDPLAGGLLVAAPDFSQEKVISPLEGIRGIATWLASLIRAFWESLPLATPVSQLETTEGSVCLVLVRPCHFTEIS